LWIHIAAGFSAFFCAPVALLTLKGGKVHRRFGKYYFWLMAVVAATGAVIAVYRPIFFLAMIAVFSFYFAFRGYRVLFRKQGGPQAIDWLAAILSLLASVGLVAIGVLKPAGVRMPAASVSIVFGAIGIWIAGSDVFGFLRQPRDKNFWWYDHMSGMLGSYIGALSAFSAVNLRFIPMPWRWLWPTILGVPVIFVWIAYYHTKFDRKKEAATA
jgi:uncharacterized membrane protein